jgi:hypothetical protein
VFLCSIEQVNYRLIHHLAELPVPWPVQWQDAGVIAATQSVEVPLDIPRPELTFRPVAAVQPVLHLHRRTE